MVLVISQVVHFSKICRLFMLAQGLYQANSVEKLVPKR